MTKQLKDWVVNNNQENELVISKYKRKNANVHLIPGPSA
jgi:hypothetical protein